MYGTRLEQLIGASLSSRVHSTHLKNRILAHFQNLQAHKEGRDVILIFSEDVGSAIKKACELDGDTEAMHLLQAANIIRKKILINKKASFNGTFDSQCQEASVPNSLVALVSMILYGPNIKTQTSCTLRPQAALTLSQLLVFNTVARCRDENFRTIRHNPERETPLPLYLGVLIHTKTRKKELVDCLFELGLCISYDRVMSISTNLGNALCHHFEMEKVVCPPKLRKQVFTTAAIDNIDHNPSSTTAWDSLHGTAISLFQHPRYDAPGFERQAATYFHEADSTSSNRILELPLSYTNVPPVTLTMKDPLLPKIEGRNQSGRELIPQALNTEYRYIFCFYFIFITRLH
jgi:hypothetical protein